MRGRGVKCFFWGVGTSADRQRCYCVRLIFQPSSTPLWHISPANWMTHCTVLYCVCTSVDLPFTHKQCQHSFAETAVITCLSGERNSVLCSCAHNEIRCSMYFCIQRNVCARVAQWSARGVACRGNFFLISAWIIKSSGNPGSANLITWYGRV